MAKKRHKQKKLATISHRIRRQGDGSEIEAAGKKGGRHVRSANPEYKSPSLGGLPAGTTLDEVAEKADGPRKRRIPGKSFGKVAYADQLRNRALIPISDEDTFAEAIREIQKFPDLKVDYDPETNSAQVTNPARETRAQRRAQAYRDKLPAPTSMRGLPISVSEMYENRVTQAMFYSGPQGEVSFQEMQALYSQNGVHLTAGTLRDWYVWALTTNNSWWVSREITKNIREAADVLEEFVLEPTMFAEPCGFVWFDGQMKVPLEKGIVIDSNGDTYPTAQTDVIQGFTWSKVWEWDEHPEWGTEKPRYHFTSAYESEVRKLAASKGVGAVTERVTFFLFTNVVMNGVTHSGLMSYHFPLGITMSKMLSDMGDSPEVLERDRSRLTIIGTFLLWCQQKILLESHRQAPDRAARRRVDALHKPGEARIDVQQIKVVTLRAQKSKPKSDEEGEEREWSCRWIVRPFWRQQWYPSLGIHQAKYIGMYVKGPADKPLRIPKQTLFSVTR